MQKEVFKRLIKEGQDEIREIELGKKRFHVENAVGIVTIVTICQNILYISVLSA